MQTFIAPVSAVSSRSLTVIKVVLRAAAAGGRPSQFIPIHSLATVSAVAHGYVVVAEPPAAGGGPSRLGPVKVVLGRVVRVGHGAGDRVAQLPPVEASSRKGMMIYDVSPIVSD